MGEIKITPLDKGKIVLKKDKDPKKEGVLNSVIKKEMILPLGFLEFKSEEIKKSDELIKDNMHGLREQEIRFKSLLEENPLKYLEERIIIAQRNANEIGLKDWKKELETLNSWKEKLLESNPEIKNKKIIKI